MSRSHRSEAPPISKSGARAREQLLEAAGEVFAEKGFHGATSREICIRAEVNQAAVNYHFGGFEALYIATLKEAHRRAVWIEPADAQGFDDLSPREKLRSVIRNLVDQLSRSPAQSWEMRLVAREMVVPTFAQAEFIATSIEPRRAFIKAIVGEILGRPAEDPTVGRCLLTIIAPCVMMSIISRPTLEGFLPDLVHSQGGIERLVDHIEQFVMAGLEAIAKDKTISNSPADSDALETASIR
jgi:AcrR family transcriptional regulator